MRRILTTLLILGIVAPAAASPPPIAVTTCGQVVPRRTVGYLTSDLDCSGPQTGAAAIAAVFVAQRGTLELRGYTISGLGIVCAEPATDSLGQPAFRKVGACTIDGGGGIVAGAAAHGIVAKKLTAHDITIRDSGQEGAWSWARVTFDNVVITGSGGFGARFDVGKVTVTNSTITGNGEYGIDTDRLVLTGSTVIDNGIGPNCGPPPLLRCADLHAYRLPQLIDSTCGTSVMTTHPETWGVCQSD
jgi:hypothetical protein